ncbi:PWWP domain-containing protein [Phytophthora infestans]|uniref:PWWP domain-containing protein n=1 Tax=Phytophthora infestans TaxID=4787 RepID=A0A833WA29_PHYIN|nr:PWWP domain-containing protein [Phytophthora infestans]
MSAELIAPALQEGDWLDVVDGDGIWNVAQVLRLPTPETVEVTYDCWGDEYNEELRRDSERIAPFHTHTWAVKCWAKLDTWPWWPALLTVRAPGSAQGSQNLRLEGRLLVDFLDKVEFKERCRCWVEKSKVTAFQSDEEARNVLTKLKKKKNKSKGEVRLKNLALSTELLSMCDAREDFPEFVEGTLPVQFKKNYTRPTAAVREEMGEEIWKREFADNRVKHASTHAYLPLLRDGSNSDSGNLTEKTGSSPAKSGQTSHDRATSSSPGAGKDDASSVSKESKGPKDVTVAPENPEIPTQKPVNFRKRARSHEEEESSSSTDTSRAGKTKAPRQAPQESQSTAAKETLSTDTDQTGKTKAPRKQTQENESTTKKTHTSKTDGNSAQAKRNQKPKPAAKEIHVSPRKYGKTPKVLRSQRKRAANLPPYTPPHTRVLLKAKPGDEKNVTRSNIPNHARDAPCAKTDVADKHLLPTDQQETSAAAKKNATNESKDVEESTSPMKNLARLTKATVRADEQLQNIETALESKLTELAEKSAKAEELRNKCAALKTRVLSPPPAPASPTHIPQEELPHESSPTHSSTSISIREAQKVRKESTRREKNANGRPGDTRSPTLARRSSPAKCGIRGLELVLDDLLAKDLNQSLSAATTTAELDAIKAELLAFPEVRAAIARIQYPSYATATRGVSCVAGLPPRKASSLSGDNDRRVWEKAKSRFTKYAASTPSQSFEPKKLSPWSPSQQFVGSWGYQSDVELNTEHFQSPSSLLLDSLSPDQSSFGFSVNDNFSMNQWYQDLYPKTFGFQRPER